jgi:hypothetical protein
LFSGKFVEGCADPAGIFFWENQEIVLSPAGEVNSVHLDPVKVEELVQFAGFFFRISASPSSIACRVSH